MPADLSNVQFDKVHGLLGSQGGFTVNPHTGREITSGISVAPYGNSKVVPVGDSTPDVLQHYAEANLRRFGPEGGRNASLGGWRSEDSDFFDTPTVYKHTPGGEAGARKQMVLSRQEAGFDLDSFEEVFNPFHEEGRRKTGREPHELAVGHDSSRERAEWVLQQPEVQAWVNFPRNGRRG